MTNKMQMCRVIYCCLLALRVSSDIFVYHQGASKLYLQLPVLHTYVVTGWCHGRVGIAYKPVPALPCVIPEAVNTV